MSKSFVTRKFNFKRSQLRRRTVSQKIKKSETFISILLFTLVISMSLVYVYQISTVATDGYEFKEHEDNLVNLKKENQKILIKLADLKAMYNFEDYNNKLVAIEYDNVHYVVSGSRAVAIRR